jgi:hypothetical protein
VAKADLDFFGWKQVQIGAPNKPQWRIDTAEFQETADADGQVMPAQNKLTQDMQWLITAKQPKDDKQNERLAYLGFSGVWYGNYYDPEYNATKVFTITDRPVYRPMNTVHFKFWVEHAKYDQADKSSFGGQTFTVQIHNPQGEKVYEKAITADEYGGLEGEFGLSKNAMLGVYQLHIVNHGGGTFRVEEYKKPEFEVTIDAPKEPVRLGEKVEATIKAKYYFGAPVTKGTVKYKVLRNSYSSRWYPAGTWDWFYGKGYWWYAYDYAWYPGFAEWGCRRPIPWWYQWRAAPPEVVAEAEAPVGPDGTLKVVIDTAPAKEMHGDTDHQYSITAEVVDESRRTIVGQGNVIVSRKPFEVFSWVDRGHYRVGDNIEASFYAQTLAGKPVEGKGELTLLAIEYKDGKPVEKAVQTWKVDTNVEGRARQQPTPPGSTGCRTRSRTARTTPSRAATSSWCAAKALTDATSGSTTWSW